MDKKIIERQFSYMDIEIISELRAQLADELEKPENERDERLIAELEETIEELKNEVVEESEKRSFDNVMKMLDGYEKPSHRKLYKRLAVAAVCVVMLLGINAASLNVFGMNAISAAYRITKGGIVITPEITDNDEIPLSETDPYGMKAKCAEHGFVAEIPDHIPYGYDLDHIWEDSNEEKEIVTFFYKRGGKTKLNFFYTYYKDGVHIPPFGIPTDTYNIQEEKINGKTVYILKEDKQFTAVWIDNRIKYTIFAEKLDYDECERILRSVV